MEDEEPERTKCQLCIVGCKKVTTFTLSHVGLLSLVVCYCLVGAAIFEALEAGHEKLVKQNITEIRKKVALDLWNMTQSLTVIKSEDWYEYAAKSLKAFENELIKQMKNEGWDGSEDPKEQNWNTLGALFYSIIVITTIGYGHIAPKTMWGRIITIFYAIIGIPLMVVCWSHIGDFMANSFRVIYWKACCYLCTRNPTPERITPGSSRSSRRTARGPPSGSSIRMKSRSMRRSARTSQRSADSALSADSVHSVASDPGFLHVGMGSIKSHSSHHRSTHGPHRNTPHSSTLPRTTQPKSAGPPWRHRAAKSEEPDYYSASPAALKNLPVLFNRYAEDTFSSPSQGLETTVEYSGEEDIEEEVPPRPRLSRSRTRTGHQDSQQSYSSRYIPPPEELDYWEEDEEYLEDFGYTEERYARRPVPIWLCAFLVISYIIGGAFLFSAWETWNLLDSAYFCFITLSTIGFGDYVPRLNKKNPEVSIALCSLYLLFGIALLAMSFNLVQEQVINAFKELALRLGIINEEDDER